MHHEMQRLPPYAQCAGLTERLRWEYEGRRHIEPDCPQPEHPLPFDDWNQSQIEEDDEIELTQQRRVVEEPLKYKPVVVKYPGRAGEVISRSNDNENDTYAEHLGTDNSNRYFPFTSKLEWDIARWAKLRGPGSTAFTELMNIDGVAEKLELTFKNTAELNDIIDSKLPGQPRFIHHEVTIGSEVCDVYFRDVIECIKSLFGDTKFAPYLVFAPEKHYTNEDKDVRMYHDMYTGRWWWKTQEALEQQAPGATIVPILISTDKTQLTLFRNKSAYPVYLSIGNIPKEIRRKPSSRTYILLGYLPTTLLETVTNKSARRRMLANLYHFCMSKILKPLEKYGKSGIAMTTAYGNEYRVHPLLATFIGDYPEQVLTTCVYYMDCASCATDSSNLGTYNRGTSLPVRDLEDVLNILDSYDTNPKVFLQTCKEARIKPVTDPFWKNLPYVDIYRSITPDVLHQLYQGIIKHLVSWVTKAYGAAEIDARCRRLPPNHNIRFFSKGISSLSQVTGQEHHQMAQILLGLIIGIPLPNGLSPAHLVRSVRALLDFLYLAQYPVHTDETLRLLEDSLEQFHRNKQIFVDLDIREDFDFPKLHFAVHYVTKIKLFGTTDNFNMEYTERLHIDYAKEAYRATNHKDEFPQMTLWLERKEKIHRHEQYIAWCRAGRPMPPKREWSPPGLELNRTIHLSKYPSKCCVSLNDMATKYGAVYFREAFARFVALELNPNLRNNRELDRAIWGVYMPAHNFHVWHRIKFLHQDPYTGALLTVDSIHVRPGWNNGRHAIPGRFDTALIRDGETEENTTETGIAGNRVGRIRVVFSIPTETRKAIFRDPENAPEHLAYVEWYSNFPRLPDPNSLMYKITMSRDADGGPSTCEIIPIEKIRRSIHLFPQFGRYAPPEWTSSNVLDKCGTFYVNNFTDKHLYRIIV